MEPHALLTAIVGLLCNTIVCS